MYHAHGGRVASSGTRVRGKLRGADACTTRMEQKGGTAVAKSKGKSAKKNKHRQQGRAQQGQRDRQAQGAGEQQAQGSDQQQAQERGSRQSGRQRRVATVKPTRRGAQPISVTPEFVSQIEGMSDEWRTFYGAISQAVKEG